MKIYWLVQVFSNSFKKRIFFTKSSWIKNLFFLRNFRDAQNSARIATLRNFVRYPEKVISYWNIQREKRLSCKKKSCANKKISLHSKFLCSKLLSITILYRDISMSHFFWHTQYITNVCVICLNKVKSKIDMKLKKWQLLK